MKYVERSAKILAVLAIATLLYLSSLYSYLLFHSLAEVFSICIAITVFFVTWNSRGILKNNYLVMVGTAYFFIGFLDFFHALSYKGMAIFTDYDYYANQLWIAARYFESLILLISFLMVKSKKHVSAPLLFVIYTAVTACIMLSIFVWKVFPIAFVEGYGLTMFKKISEYVICVILLVAIFVLFKHRAEFDKKVYGFLFASLTLTIVTELCFTTYVTNYDFRNLLGHFFKIAAYYFIYKALIRTGITEPYNLIFREMKQTEKQLSEQNQLLSSKTIADDLTIQEHLNLLKQQYKTLNRQSKLLDLSQEAIFVWDLNGAIVYWNKGAELMYGYTAEEAIGRTSDELLKTKRPVSLEETRSILERRSKWVGVLDHTTKDGNILCVESSHQLYVDEDGSKVVLEICRDITERNQLESSLRYENNLRYAVIENTSDAVFVYDIMGNVTMINSRANTLYQDLLTEKTTARTIFEEYLMFDLERHPIGLDNYPTRRAIRGESISNERYIIEKENFCRIIEVNATPILDSQDQVLAIVVCHHDITELIEKQNAIIENLRQLQEQHQITNRQASLLNLSNEPIFAWELNGAIIYWNKGAQQTYGYTQEEAIGATSHSLLKTHHKEPLVNINNILIEKGNWTGELFHTAKDGRTLLIESAHQLYRQEDGSMIVLEICKDITERRAMELEISYRNNLLNGIIENMNDALFIYDRTGKPISMNASARELYQINLTNETTYKDIRSKIKLFRLDHRPVPYEEYPLTRGLRGETIRNERYIVETETLSKFIEINALAINDAQGELAAVVVLNHDITELIKRQAAIEEHVIQLQQQNKLLNRQAKLLDLSNEAIFAWYIDGPIIYWNQGAQKVYGYSEDEAVGCYSHLLLKSNFSLGYDDLKAELMEKGSWTGYIERTAKDGRRLIIETRVQVIINDVGLNTVLESNRDVTEKITAENAIRKNSLELEKIINSTDDYIWSIDNDYRIIFCNKSVTDFTRKYYSFEMVPGLPFLDFIPPENASSYRELFNRVKTEGEITVDMHSFRGDKFITYSFHPVYLDSQLIEITIFGRDITERIKSEKEIIKLNASLESRINERTKELRESLETIQNFTLMMTHDLKTPLNEIDIYAKQLRNKADCQETADIISVLCNDMSAMISGLIDYDRINSTDVLREPVNIKKMIDNVFSELKTENAVLNYQTGIPTICADAGMIRRVVANLLSNALKFSVMREKPVISVGCRKEKDEFVFYIKDNGIGIDMEYADKLFNVFERLHSKDEFEGHGIGLASVRSIISKHGGRTWIQGKPGTGTTVYFSLPVKP